MSLKVLLVVLNIIILGANTEGISENEFVLVSTSESPEEESTNRNSETISKIEETNRHLLAVLTQMVDAAKSEKKKQDSVDNAKEQFAQIQRKLQLLEKSNQEQQQSVSTLEQSLNEKDRKLQLIEKSNEEKSRKISDMQKMLDQQEKTIGEQQTSLSRMESNLKLENEKIVQFEALYKRFKQLFPRNCKEIQENGKHLSGVYRIRPKSESFNVWCDMDNNGGGWTLVQNRFDGSENFNRNWTDYEEGFGNLTGEFWLGLRHLYELTGDHTNELLIELVDKNDKKVYALYGRFSVDSEERLYAIKSLHDYEGTAGNSFDAHHLGAKFSTWDRDNTRYRCPERYKSGWWFFNGACLYCNLNGKYSHDGTISQRAEGINWILFSTDNYSLLKSKMMVRPR